MKTFSDFHAFSQARRDLAHWHLNYETVACHLGVAVEEVLAPASSQAPTVADRRYRVTKMKFGKIKDATGKSVNDKTTVIYNDYITLKNIPLAAYDYIVNGKPALEWVMERQSVTTDKDSSITNHANLWGHRNHGQPQVSARAVSSGGDGELGDDEDREWASRVEHPWLIFHLCPRNTAPIHDFHIPADTAHPPQTLPKPLVGGCGAYQPAFHRG